MRGLLSASALPHSFYLNAGALEGAKYFQIGGKNCQRFLESAVVAGLPVHRGAVKLRRFVNTVSRLYVSESLVVRIVGFI